MGIVAFRFFRSGKYDLDFKSPNHLNKYIIPEQLINLYKSFTRENPVVSIKIPLAMMVGET